MSIAKKTGRGKAAGGPGPTSSEASELIDRRIADLGDWRGRTLAQVRRLVKHADSGIVEEWKWRGVPTWSHGGIVCTGETYTKVVKLTFAKGASLHDPQGLFNASLDGNVRRAIDIHEADVIDEKALKALIQQAVELNVRGAPAARSSSKARKQADANEPVRLLAGGNPKIAKADGAAPVQAYIAAIPGWKRAVGRRLDTLVASLVPGVRRAVKWNSPFYGVEGRGWFLSFHVFSRAVKVTFFRGTALRPQPPGGKSQEARWIDIHEDDFDEKQLTAWVKQAAAKPGWLA